MRAHLDEAHAAADRLVREAQRQAEEAARGATVPPRGWDAGGRERGAGVRARPQGCSSRCSTRVRDAIPAELSRQLAEALRDLLLALRALIDWYLERLGEPAPARDRVEVEDIPLD